MTGQDAVDQCLDSLCALKEIAKAIAQEPSFNSNSSAFWTAIIAGLTALITLLLFFVAIMELVRAFTMSDTELLIKSNSEYEGLYEGLILLPKIRKQYIHEFTSKFDLDKFEPEAFQFIKGKEISDDHWKEIRGVKNFYKQRYSLLSYRLFSKWAIQQSLDRYGRTSQDAQREHINLIKAIDAYRFYQARIDEWELVDSRSRDMSADLKKIQFEKRKQDFDELYKQDFDWYDKLLEFMVKPIGRPFIRHLLRLV